MHYKKWECVEAGFFDTQPPKGKTNESCLKEYRDFLSNLDLFESQIKRVFKEWPKSSEQFLTNESINRVAWIGQASMCIYSGVPSCFKSGFSLLTNEQQDAANALAENYLRKWIKEYHEKQAEEKCQKGQLVLT